MIKIMRSLRSSKCLKTIAELTFATKKTNACSPWTACSVFNWKYLFWVNLVQKLKIISLSWNFVPRLIQICRIPWWYSLFLFSSGTTFLGKSDPKNQNWAEFRTRLIWICRIMKKTCVVHFFCFRSEKPFLGKSSQKNRNCQFKLTFGTKTNSNMQNSIVIFTVFVSDWNYSFWANLVQKIKIISLSWNFALDQFECAELSRK